MYHRARHRQSPVALSSGPPTRVDELLAAQGEAAVHVNPRTRCGEDPFVTQILLEETPSSVRIPKPGDQDPCGEAIDEGPGPLFRPVLFIAKVIEGGLPNLTNDPPQSFQVLALYCPVTIPQGDVTRPALELIKENLLGLPKVLVHHTSQSRPEAGQLPPAPTISSGRTGTTADTKMDRPRFSFVLV